MRVTAELFRLAVLALIALAVARQVYVGELARPYQDYRERASSSPRLLRSFTDSTHSIPYNYGVGHQS